jgi:peptide/nickel transport system substrate-binding protein
MVQRNALFSKAFEQLHQDPPILYLYSPCVPFGMSAKVQGFVPAADGVMRLKGVTLTN